MKNFQIKIANRIWSLKLRGQVQIVEFFKENRVQTERKSGAGSENALVNTNKYVKPALTTAKKKD